MADDYDQLFQDGTTTAGGPPIGPLVENPTTTASVVTTPTPTKTESAVAQIKPFTSEAAITIEGPTRPRYDDLKAKRYMGDDE